MSLKTVLFGERAAGVYLKSEIYDPELGTTPEASGKYVPAVGSLVVDDSVGLHNIVYVVTDVDQSNYKATLVPASYVLNSESQVDRVLSYGNDIFMLYFSSVVKNVSGSNINLTRLIVDNKLSLFGNHAATYQLVRTDSNGIESVISKKYNVVDPNQEIQEFTPAGTSIPMLETGVDGIRKCDGCYTDITDLKEGDVVRCDIYTAGGIPIAQVNLVAKKAHLLNESIGQSNPIVDMTIEGTQQFSNGDLFLFQGQNVSELAIYVKLHYANGEKDTIAIDNRRGFCYGLEAVSSGIIGAEFEILVKYYLSFGDDVNIDQNSSTEYTDNNIRFISKRAKIRIESNEQDLISKVSVIPYWSQAGSATGRWYLNFLKYREAKNTSPYATSNNIDQEYVGIDENTPFDGTLFNVEQRITVKYRERINTLGTTIEKTQDFIIEVRNKTNFENDFTYWLIRDDNNSPTYGDNTGQHIRPRIVYDSNNGYHIPASEFSANSGQTAIEVFLDNFYYNANPPKYGNSAAPVPTHFVVKDKKGTSIIQNAVPIDEFTSTLSLIIPTSESASYFVGQTLVVEFLQEIDTGTTYTLYGVPVDVVNLIS